MVVLTIYAQYFIHIHFFRKSEMFSYIRSWLEGLLSALLMHLFKDLYEDINEEHQDQPVTDVKTRRIVQDLAERTARMPDYADGHAKYIKTIADDMVLCREILPPIQGRRWHSAIYSKNKSRNITYNFLTQNSKLMIKVYSKFLRFTIYSTKSRHARIRHTYIIFMLKKCLYLPQSEE
jgi:hypothetical protein